MSTWINHQTGHGTHRGLSRWVGIVRIQNQGAEHDLGQNALLWLIGIPLPIIILLAFFWR